jgi:hypothetical protein
MTRANNWLQARPGCAWLFVLAHRPGLPEPKRYAASYDLLPQFVPTAVGALAFL